MKQQTGTQYKKARSKGQKRRRNLRKKYEEDSISHAVKRRRRSAAQVAEKEKAADYRTWRDKVVSKWRKIFGLRDKLHNPTTMEKEIEAEEKRAAQEREAQENNNA